MLIETALYFILGFLCAALLALMVAPAIWRRAVALTRRRVEASIPLTLDQIKADKDALRAEFAMAARRLEMKVKELQDKSAVQAIDIDRKREELKAQARESEEKNRVIADLEERIARMTEGLSTARKNSEEDRENLEAAQARLHEKVEEMKEIERLHEDTSLLSSSRQIELVARESQLEKLSGDVSALRREGKDAQRRVRELTTQNKTLQQSLRDHKSKAAGVEHKMEHTIAAMSDMEERLERRDREIARLRAQIGEMSGAGDTPEDAAQDLRSAAMEELMADHDRLEARLHTVLEENRQLRMAKAAHGNDEEAPGIERENAVLREQIHDLAAQVTSMTALLEGETSPINEALSVELAEGANGHAHTASLAERIRSLQKRAGAV